jgi:hypothetical protein
MTTREITMKKSFLRAARREIKEKFWVKKIMMGESPKQAT